MDVVVLGNSTYDNSIVFVQMNRWFVISCSDATDGVLLCSRAT